MELHGNVFFNFIHHYSTCTTYLDNSDVVNKKRPSASQTRASRVPYKPVRILCDLTKKICFLQFSLNTTTL